MTADTPTPDDPTDFTNPATVDVNEVMAHIRCTRCGRYFDDPVLNDPVPDVVRTACTLWNVPVSQLLSPSRKAAVVAARHPIMAVLYHEFQLTLVDIGAELDRDHTTVLHGIRRADPDRVAQLIEAVNEG